MTKRNVANKKSAQPRRDFGKWLPIFAILIATMTLLGSFAPVLADSEGKRNGPEESERSKNAERSLLGAGETNPGLRLGQNETLKERLQDLRENRQELAKKTIQERNQLLKQAREVAKERYQATLERHIEVKKEYKDVQKDFLSAREDFRKAGKIGANRTNETAYLERARGYLTSSADYVITLIDHVENEVNLLGPDNMTIGNGTLSDLKAEWLDRLGAQKDNVTAIKLEIGAAATKEELSILAKELQASWNGAIREAKRILGFVLVERARFVHDSMERVSERVKSLERKLNSTGNNMTGLEEKMARYDSLLLAARNHFEEAKGKYSSGMNEEAKKALASAQSDMNEAKDVLRKILSELKGQAGKGD